MTLRQIDYRIGKLEELEAARAELDKQIDELKTAIQTEMGDAETLETPKFIIRWTAYIRNAFDSKAFKAEHAKLYADYTRSTQSRRFSYAAR